MLLSSPELQNDLQALIVKSCNIEFDLPDDLTHDEPLIGPESPYGLDSLDAVEIIVAVQRRYGVRIAADENNRAALQSINTLAAYVRELLANQK
jgi:acyl carrier protein